MDSEMVFNPGSQDQPPHTESYAKGECNVQNFRISRWQQEHEMKHRALRAAPVGLHRLDTHEASPAGAQGLNSHQVAPCSRWVMERLCLVMSPGPPPGGGNRAPGPLKSRTEVEGARTRKVSSPPEFRGQKSDG